MNKPLRKASEIVTPEPPKAPQPPPMRVRPTKADLARYVGCSGTHRPQAVHAAEQRAQEYVAIIQAVSPQSEQAIRSSWEQAESHAEQAANDAARIGEVIFRLIDDMAKAADLRQQVAQLKTKLADADAKLNAVTALDLADDQVLLLTNQARHLPARIADFEKQIAELESACAAGVKEAKVDGEKLLAHMKREAGPADGKPSPRNIHLHGLFTGGFVKIP